jgi:hypothetical protein
LIGIHAIFLIKYIVVKHLCNKNVLPSLSFFLNRKSNFLQMKILFQYLKPYKWLVVLTLILAAINTGFSLCDPIILGKLVKLAFDYKNVTKHDFFLKPYNSVIWLLIASISVAMVSRIAKNF